MTSILYKKSNPSQADSLQNMNDNQTNYANAALERNLTQIFDSENLNLQIIKRQNNIMHYYSTISASNQEGHSYKNLLKVIDGIPTNLISYYSTLVFNRVSLWIQKFITMPKEIASIISQFFVNDDHLSFFAYITFPSIFHHFVTSEFCDHASQLVINMILYGQRYVANIFALSYLQSSKFFETLWYNFDSSNPKEDVYVRFIQSIQAANVCFTKSQIQIFIHLFEKSRVNFGRVIYGRLFWNSYIEFHEGHEESPISKLLQSMIIMTRSTQFTEIYNAIITQKFSNEKIKLEDFGNIHKIPIILSPHEILYLQRIAQSSPSLFGYPLDESEKLKVHKSCENNLKHLQFNIDLASIFKVNTKSCIHSIFTNSLCDNSNFNNNSLIYNDHCKWTDSIIEKNANYQLYLSLIEREKYTKSKMIKKFSKFLLRETEKRDSSSSSPFSNWINRFYKINFNSSSSTENESDESAPKIESKVFKYSFKSHISNCHNKEAKLWIYLRNYAKCDRSIFQDAGYTKIFDYIKNIKIQVNDDFNNSSFDNIFQSICSITNSFPFHDKASTLQISSILGKMIKDTSIHFGIPGDKILLQLFSQTHYRKLSEEIIWSKMILQHVPEIKKLLPKDWDDGLNFIFEVLRNILFTLASGNKEFHDILSTSQMESFNSLDSL